MSSLTTLGRSVNLLHASLIAMTGLTCIAINGDCFKFDLSILSLFRLWVDFVDLLNGFVFENNPEKSGKPHQVGEFTAQQWFSLVSFGNGTFPKPDPLLRMYFYFKLVTNLQPCDCYESRNSPIRFFSTDIALPEDQELQGFLPLQSVHRFVDCIICDGCIGSFGISYHCYLFYSGCRKLDFASNRNSKKEEQQERKNRLLQFGLSLSRHISG